MGILSIEPHKELDLDQMMLGVGFTRHRDWQAFADYVIIYRWIHAEAYGLGIQCQFYRHNGRYLLKKIFMRAEPDFSSYWDRTSDLMLEGQDALDKIREYILKQTDGIIDIFKEL